ncbi:MAG: hypothetical protein JNM74_20255 [Myxococcales bacterium]|nr:hypothetical protein [Myxococcales bacterium]
MKIAFVVLLVVHGLIHAMGFAKAFGLAELAALKVPIGRGMGLVWLGAALALLATAVMVATSRPTFWVPAIVALVASQLAIVTSWSDAKFGTLPNVVLLAPVALALLDLRPGSFRSTYHAEIADRLNRPTSDEPSLLTEGDLASLPPLVATYVRRTGAVGLPRVRDVAVTWEGTMVLDPKKPNETLKTIAVQHNFHGAETARIFFMEGAKAGIPFQGLHRYVGEHARFQVRVAQLFDVVDGRGPEMDQSETVTLFNDVCLLAPALLPFVDVSWEPEDGRSIRARFTNAGHTIHATLRFDASGDLVDFVSEDRFQSPDGKTFVKYPWSTPMHEYTTFAGRRAPSRGEAIWHEPRGPLVYARLRIVDIAWNVSTKGAAARPPSKPGGGA